MNIHCYKRKPNTVQAVKIETGILEVIAEWCGGKVIYCQNGYGTGIRIPTLEGNMNGEIGSFIIKGTAGEFYPCKPDIFDDVYEKKVIL